MTTEWPWRRVDPRAKAGARPAASQAGSAAPGQAPGQRPESASIRPSLALRWRRLYTPVRLALVVLALAVLWWGVIGSLQAGIEVDDTLRPSAVQLPAGGSVAVANATRLLERQVTELTFTPDDPAFFPTGFARRTAAFQSQLVLTVRGVIDGLASDRKSQPLQAAAALLHTPPDVWWVRLAMPPVGRPAERVYAEAIGKLEDHNRLVATEGRIVPTRLSVAERLALANLMRDAEGQAQRIDMVMREGNRQQQVQALAAARGTAFAAMLLMRGMRDDNFDIVRASGQAAQWMEAIDRFHETAVIDPLFVADRHLLRAGYSLMIAGRAIRIILGDREPAAGAGALERSKGR